MTMFGTDGVRGRAGRGPLSAAGALRLGSAFVQALPLDTPRLAIARDTRLSGATLAAAVTAGIVARGGHVVDLGVLPTPGLSWCVSQDPSLDGGLMLTASHNPWHDNGIKFFGADGRKVADAVQDACAAAYEAGFGDDVDVPGTVRSGAQAARRAYLEDLVGAVPAGALRGKRVAADTASGAGEGIFEELLLGLGADVVSIAPPSDGRNINEAVGAVHPEALAAAVKTHSAWAGVALDGDGDRLMIVDEKGQVQDGDALLGVLAHQEHTARGGLPAGVVVGTVHSGSGLQQWVEGLGLTFLRTPVGDRHIAAALVRTGGVLGGESSGHILTPEVCPTGDGLRTAVRFLAGAAAGPPLSEVLGRIPRFPRATRKVAVAAKPPLDSMPDLGAFLAEADRSLAAAGGRRLVRYSGTEPVLRVLVEGPDADLVEIWADRIADAARTSLCE